jgi:hypothetical protein
VVALNQIKNDEVKTEKSEIVAITENVTEVIETTDILKQPANPNQAYLESEADDNPNEIIILSNQLGTGEPESEITEPAVGKTDIAQPEIAEPEDDSESIAMVDEVSLNLATSTYSDFKRVESDKSSKKTFPVTKIVQRGDEVFDLCQQVYGFCNNQVLQLVKANNPHIRNINIIYPDLKIIFPALDQLKRIEGK